MWLSVAALLLCVCMSAFFSASETAYSSMNKVRLKTIEGHQRAKAQLALKLGEDYDNLLMTILVGNNIVNIAGTAISTVLFTNLLSGNAGATVSTVVMTVVILIFGEISPKSLAKENAETVAMFAARPLYVIGKILVPLGLFFKMWKKILRKVFRPRDDESIIEAELITMVDEATDEGDMDIGESELIRSAIAFNDRDALDIMTPRVDVTGLEDTATDEEAGELFRMTDYSRLPVFHEDLDHIVGVLNEKDFHKMKHLGESDIRKIMKAPVFAPATLQISKLLKLFQETQTHLVVLLDEYGGTEGIVTMEDVLEQLVGEIYDEHDDVDELISQREDGSCGFDGSIRLEDLLEQYGISDSFEADTVGGWAAEMLKKIPEEGDHFEYHGLHCTVTGMEKRRVTQVTINGQYLSENEGGD